MEGALKVISKLNSSQNSSNFSLQPIRVQQAVKAVCALMGHVETIEITEALALFCQICSMVTCKTLSEDSKAKVTFDDGDYSIVEMGSSALKCIQENLIVQCDKIREAIRGLIESYCNAFNVDFTLGKTNPSSLGKFFFFYYK